MGLHWLCSEVDHTEAAAHEHNAKITETYYTENCRCMHHVGYTFSASGTQLFGGYCTWLSFHCCMLSAFRLTLTTHTD